jgi:hypothetical protein
MEPTEGYHPIVIVLLFVGAVSTLAWIGALVWSLVELVG